MLIRFTLAGLPKGHLGQPLAQALPNTLGVVAGFVDSTGGGWGPVGTPAILASGRLEPRKTIGSIDTSGSSSPLPPRHRAAGSQH